MADYVDPHIEIAKKDAIWLGKRAISGARTEYDPPLFSVDYEKQKNTQTRVSIGKRFWRIPHSNEKYNTFSTHVSKSINVYSLLVSFAQGRKTEVMIFDSYEDAHQVLSRVDAFLNEVDEERKRRFYSHLDQQERENHKEEEEDERKFKVTLDDTPEDLIRALIEWGKEESESTTLSEETTRTEPEPELPVFPPVFRCRPHPRYCSTTVIQTVEYGPSGALGTYDEDGHFIPVYQPSGKTRSRTRRRQRRKKEKK